MATVEAETAKARGRKNGGIAHNRAAKKAEFLKLLGEGNYVAYSAQEAGIGRRTVYEWRDTDEAFATAWDEAELASKENLERIAYKRAADSSDSLVMFLLKRRDPAYRDSHQVEINHSGTVEHEHKVVSASAVLHILQDAEGFDGFEAPGLAGPGGALPSTRELLAAHPDTEAGSVPSASAS